ncbi:dihydrolipoyl dehydrogenase [Gelria sp. Kuro-4]|uniref:dihydrolipoyl dehydrogenase n=1 Tax=Gelria sp. Kuro-4 TaxID=2796927 RepID=UPI001BEF864A|nr:dihydrolipoyl dehydrogenase [Gelria sp. Kuro-4]BCV23460.1 dihydrolipoyl dehydrogenase [Gelria sp. Kuro-4]
MHLVVIGGGPAGYVGALRAARLGAAVTLVEGRRLGGTCLNVGCMPTKALLHTTELLAALKEAGRLGLEVEGLRLNWPRLLARKEAVVNQLVQGVGTLLKRAGVKVIAGRGRLVGPGRVRVTAEGGTAAELTADRVLLALGSEPARPPIPGLELPGVIDSDAALSLPEVPARLAIVGGGVIGVELASVFAAAGSRVTIVEMLPEILPPVDAELAAQLRGILTDRGLSIKTAAKVLAIEERADGLALKIEVGGQEETIPADKVLVAAGRRPATKTAGLEAAGVKLERGRIVVDEYLETSLPGVYAAGDAIGGTMLAHVGFYEGEVAVENALGGKKRRVDYKAVPSAVYTSPEVAGVGLTEDEARKQGFQIKVGRFPLAANGKALIENGGRGLVKVIANARYGEILGVHILGPRATDLIAEAALAIGLEATLDEVAHTVHPHPTVSEALGEACLAAQGRALHIPN